MEYNWYTLLNNYINISDNINDSFKNKLVFPDISNYKHDNGFKFLENFKSSKFQLNMDRVELMNNEAIETLKLYTSNIEISDHCIKATNINSFDIESNKSYIVPSSIGKDVKTNIIKIVSFKSDNLILDYIAIENYKNLWNIEDNGTKYYYDKLHIKLFVLYNMENNNYLVLLDDEKFSIYSSFFVYNSNKYCNPTNFTVDFNDIIKIIFQYYEKLNI